MQAWTGKAISPGFAEGAAVVYAAGSVHVTPRYTISESSIESEQERLRAAVAAAREELLTVRRGVAAELGESEASIFGTHIAFLDDRSFLARIEDRIAREAINAEQAVEAAASEVAGSFTSLADEYLRERAQDVRDVADRLIGHLLKTTSFGLERLPADAVIVSHELLPSATLRLDRRHVRAIVTEEGSKTSHAAILAKALGIPAVTGLAGACDDIPPGAVLLVDGCRGTVTMDPSPSARAAFNRDRETSLQADVLAERSEESECVTRDGTRIVLSANLGRTTEAADVGAHHLAGVGLFRTEVMFLDSASPPTVEEHEQAYRTVAAVLAGRPLVIRTMDLGGDKCPSFFPNVAGQNPRLGLRGLRLALKERELLRTQLAAILLVAQEHPVSVLFPMVVGGDDLACAVDLLHGVAEARRLARIPPVGAMIETPSSVFALPEILGICDFLSIGTNDLTQFILAADRNAADLLDDFSILHPAVLRAVRMVLETAGARNTPVTVCGEAAGDPAIAPLLVGLGVRSLSMSPVRAAHVRLTLRSCDSRDLERAAVDALQCGSVDEVRRRLQALDLTPAVRP